jgi:hypothetical protein
MKRHIIFAIASALLWTATLAGQTVATGEAVFPENEFRSPMTLEMPFVLADPARWNDKWSSNEESADLAKYCCEKVFIESLRMRARKTAGDAVAITIKAKLRNPSGNHDKRVFLTVELQNDGVAVESVAPKRAAPAVDKGIDLEESDSSTKTTVLNVRADALKPTTVLKITMSLRNED